MVCEKCGAPMPEEGGACPLCDWAPGMEEETPEAETQAEGVIPAEGEIPAEGKSDAEVVAALFDGEERPAEAVPETVAPAKKSRKGLVAAAAAVAVVAVAVGLFFHFHKSGSTVDRAMDKAREMVELLPDNATDVSDLTVGVPADAVLLTADGVDITAEEYLYWLGNITNYYDLISSYSGTPMDLTMATEDGLTWDDQLKKAARDNAILLALTPTLAREYGAELTEADVRTVVDGRAENIAAVGGEAQYARQLQAMGINDATAMRLDLVSALYGKFQEAWLEKTVGKLTAQEIDDYVQENDLLRAKHILLLTVDMDTGEDLPEEGKAAQKAKADELLAQLRADPSKFDALMNDNSEDSGLVAYPDGYVFTAGEMVPAFEDTTRALEFGQISEVVESPYGYHIILRLDPDCDEIRQSVAAGRFNQEVQDRVDNAKVIESDLYQSFTTADYYHALLDFQTTLADPEIVDQSAAELEPAG